MQHEKAGKTTEEMQHEKVLKSAEEEMQHEKVEKTTEERCSTSRLGRLQRRDVAREGWEDFRGGVAAREG